MMKNKLKTTANAVLVIVMFGVVLMSCDPEKQWEKAEDEKIQNFLATRGDTIFELKTGGLYYHSIEEGGGQNPVDLDTVFIRYRLFYLDYALFDSNMDNPDPFGFIVGSGAVVNGIDMGVRYMKPGGRSKLLTPSSLAYGPQGRYPYVQGYTPFVWDVELTEVRPGSKK